MSAKCPECGDTETVLYPEGLNESTVKRGEKCYRCYKCGCQFNERSA